VQEQASALLHITVKDPDRDRVGKAFTAPIIELALASIPGFTTTSAPPAATAYGVYSPAWVHATGVPQQVGLPDGTTVEVGPQVVLAEVPHEAPAAPTTEVLQERTRRVRLGAVAGARSGDKGGSATLGVYARSDAGYAWLAAFLTPARLQELLPEAAGLEVSRELLPGLRSVLFQLPGLLGEGVAAGTRFDPQAKAVGEWLRSRLVDVPVSLLPPEGAR